MHIVYISNINRDGFKPPVDISFLVPNDRTGCREPIKRTKTNWNYISNKRKCVCFTPKIGRTTSKIG
ncbi:MAG: hypothetical protein ACTSQP_11170 [Promethearchaeota archaeon]